MSQSVNFHPDISQRFELLTLHTNNKHKVVNQFISILKSICDLEEFYSRNLQKIADSISKLIIGKDALKDVFIIFQRLIGSKSDEARNIADSIKNDMMPFLKDLISDEHYSFKFEDRKVREVKSEMQRKHRSLESLKKMYLRGYYEYIRNSSLAAPAVKQSMKQNLAKKQKELTVFLQQDYNKSVDNYILTLSDITNRFSDSQMYRKKGLKSAVQKFMIYQMSLIKNLEYNIDRYCKNLEGLEDKFSINDRSTDNRERIHLAKVAAHNYVEYLKSEVLETDIRSNKLPTVSSLERKYNGRIEQNQYKEVLKEMYSVLDLVRQTRDVNYLKRILQFGNKVYKTLPADMDGVQKRISLSEGMFCHDIFKDNQFWDSYCQSLLDTLDRVGGAMVSMDADTTQEVLEDQIRFFRSIKIDEKIMKGLFDKIQRQLGRKIIIQVKPEVSQQATKHEKTTDPSSPNSPTLDIKLPVNNQKEVAQKVDRGQAQGAANQEQMVEFTMQEYEAFS